jgi:hypothetical protein
MGDRNKRSVAAADVALPHELAGKHRREGNWAGQLPQAAAGPNRAPPKEGPYPADAKTPDGYGQKRAGKRRISGDSAHQVGKR